ncbi:5'/3'-nucleotidase SurE [Streptomyces sp. TBY4]|uniref:5'/3'-nucleotidase SurE n=1 Tax=Streptomyces sp. TBY4 TaxID=2962030 RepID=UPI0020B74ED4|nr:5'/3'-nucleotidase SurE [Streptomyces sp. TBY4]MCP3754731.1 5'/3'-nucleotidase SurE [Streptomyces sp. TBY4]
MRARRHHRRRGLRNHGVLTVQQRERMPAGYENDCAGAPSGAPVFGVCLADGPCGPDSPSATPADTVKLALRGGLAAKAGWSGAPGLVVTGINSGLNVSSSVNDSGTVGAAIAAIDIGVPAVAFSASANADMSAHPVENYRATAAFGAKFPAGLKQHRLLTATFALKVDYPDISAGAQAQPPVWTRSARARTPTTATYRAAAGTASRSPSATASRRSPAVRNAGKTARTPIPRPPAAEPSPSRPSPPTVPTAPPSTERRS